jgi:hypothetical protein
MYSFGLLGLEGDRLSIESGVIAITERGARINLGSGTMLGCWAEGYGIRVAGAYDIHSAVNRHDIKAVWQVDRGVEVMTTWSSQKSRLVTLWSRGTLSSRSCVNQGCSV